MKCGKCKWWVPIEPEATNGFCKRFPPIMGGMAFAGVDCVVTQVDMEDPFYVCTDDYDFCGEFTEK